MSYDIPAAVAAIFSCEPDHKSQSVGLKGLLHNVISVTNDEESLCNAVGKLAEAVVNQESVSMVVSRQFINDIVIIMDNFTKSTVKKIAINLLTIVQPRIISYEEQAAQVRFKLADIYEIEGNNTESIKTLKAIPLEAGQRSYPPELKMRTYLRIAQLALESGDALEAESFVNRASMLQNETNCDMLTTVYKAQYARVLDHRRKFIEAAQRYYELSLVPLLTNSEKKKALTNAVTCTILASPGLQRSRMLTNLFKDERCERLPSHGLLQKMHLERLIRNNEIVEFEPNLDEHQREIHDGWSVLQRAVIEHNIIAISNIFTNITFSQLAELLGIEQHKAEKIAWKMIAEERIKASLDQLDGFVQFEETDALTEWDQQIEEACQHINSIADMIAQKHGDWAEQRLEVQGKCS